MTSEEWGRVRALFEEALDIAADDREVWITGHAPTPAIAEEVRELIAVYQQWPDFLEEPAGGVTAAEEPRAVRLTGRRLGPWKLVREIGHGGMGVVWEGVRDDAQFEQRAAVKILPVALQSPQGIARFKEERQILAALQHPGIARLLDGGSMDDGSPYLVMEYVEGQRLDEWLTRDAQPLAERIRVFLAICSAVEYAHRHLIVHRDLKPANIMITPEGAPVLLDFGVARLLDPLGSGITETGTRLLTPRFASPEQIRGRPATTATDIYSLGVLLYVMLTGRQPYAGETEDTLEILRAVCTEDPVPPSAIAGPWRKALRGELDAITLECLRKDPEERYRSVYDLAEDVEAWRKGRPVRAHPPSWARRVRKLVRRNRVASAAIATAVLFLIGGSAASLWQAQKARAERQRADMRFEQVKRLANSVLFDLHNAIQRLPGSTAARRLLAEEVLDYLKDVEATGPGNGALAYELAAAYMRVGEVQSQLGRQEAGGASGAIRSLLNACRLASLAVAADGPDDRASRLLLEATGRLSDFYAEQGNAKAWEQTWPSVEKLAAQLSARHPEDRMLRFRALWYPAYRLLSAGDKSALPACERALAVVRDAVEHDPNDAEALRRLAYCYRNIGDAKKGAGDLAGAIGSYRRGMAINEKRVAADPSAAQPKMDLYLDLVLAGWATFRTGEFQAAIADYERAAQLLKGICASDPEDLRARLELSKLLITAVPAYEKLGREADVIARLKEALRYTALATARDPNNADARVHHAWALNYLGDALMRRAARGGSGAHRYWQLSAATFQLSLDTLNRLAPDARFEDGVLPGPMIAHAKKQLAFARARL